MEDQITNLSLEVSELILPYIAVMISIVFFLWFKDYATGIAKGMKFKIDPHFQEGDEVWLENEPAVILKIGMTQTIFGIINGRGYIWRFVDNESIFEMKLEKMISDKVHYDTKEEQSRKLRKLLELTEEQDEMIQSNADKDVEQDEVLKSIERYNVNQDMRMDEHKKHIDKLKKELDSEE